MTRTKLSEKEFDRHLPTVVSYVEKYGSIRNQEARAVTGITYDQAIDLFNRAICAGVLVRRGTGGGTRYVLSDG